MTDVSVPSNQAHGRDGGSVRVPRAETVVLFSFFLSAFICRCVKEKRHRANNGKHKFLHILNANFFFFFFFGFDVLASFCDSISTVYINRQDDLPYFKEEKKITFSIVFFSFVTIT